MNEQAVIEALRSGKKVTCYGNDVVGESMDYSWQTPVLRVKAKNGSSVVAGYREIRSMIIADTSKILGTK